MPGERVVVVGGGIVGGCAAYYLARAGWRVTVLDRGEFGHGCSHANCGYVCPSHVLPLPGPGAIWSTFKALLHRNSPLKVRLGVMLRNPGWFLRFARKCNRPDMLAGGNALQALLDSSRSLYDQLISDEKLDCEWQANGLLFVFRTAAAFDHYAEIDHLLAQQFHRPAKRLTAEMLAAEEPSLRPGLAGGFFYEGDAHLRPDRLMAELRRSLIDHGVEILDHRPATGFVAEAGKARAVRTDAGDIDCGRVVIATGAWTPHLNRELGCRIPIQPGKGYSLTVPRPGLCPTRPMIFEEHRVAITPFDSGYRIGSTMEFAGYDDTLNRSRLALLTEGANEYLREPVLGPAQEEWWGWRPMTPDGLPVIDFSPALGNVVIAAGHNMLGLAMAPATGKLVADLLGGDKGLIDPSPYRLSRFH